MAKPLSKGAWIGIVFAVVILAVIVFQTVGLRQVQCEVCMEQDGKKKCLTVKGEDNQQAVQTAKENACSFITNGRAEAFRCSQAQPSSINCKPL